MAVGSSSRRSGFTLVELLVVIAIIGILVALLLPAVQAAREASRRSNCNNNLKQIGIALHNYHDTYKCFPPGGLANSSTSNSMGYHVLILPFMEQEPLYNRFNFNVLNYTNTANMTVALDLPNAYVCPSATMFNGTETVVVGGITKTSLTHHYYGVMGAGSASPTRNHPVTATAYPSSNSPSGHGGFATTGVLGNNNKANFANILDGTSSTSLVGEISWHKANCYRAWIRGCESSPCGSTKNLVDGINVTPYNGSNNFNNVSFGSNHPAGANFVKADGAVAFVSSVTDLKVLLSGASRDQNEPFGAP